MLVLDHRCSETEGSCRYVGMESLLVQMGVLELFIGVVHMYSNFENIEPRMDAFERAYRDSMRMRSLFQSEMGTRIENLQLH